MKNPYMRTNIGSYERDYLLIILFQLYGPKAGLFESNLFWVGQYRGDSQIKNSVLHVNPTFAGEGLYCCDV